MGNHLLHGLWLPRSGLNLWLERVSDHRVPAVADDAIGELPAPAADFLCGRRARHRPEVTLQTPKGRRVRQPIPAWALVPETAVDLMAGLSPDKDHPGLAPDLRYLLAVRDGVHEFIRAGRVTVGLAWREGEWHPRFRLADGLEESAWLTDAGKVAPGVLGVNGNRSFVEEMCEELVHAEAVRLVREAGARPEHGFTGALLSSRPIRRNAGRAVGALNRWRESLGGRHVELVLEVLEPEDLDDAAPGEAAAGDASEDGSVPAGVDVSDLQWTVRVNYRTGVAPPVRVTPAMLRTGVRNQLGPLLTRALDAAPSLRTAEAEPGGLDLRLDYSAFLSFLERDVAALEAAGITVLLPAAWSPRVTATVRMGRDRIAKSPDAPGAGADDLAQFDWHLSLDGRELTKSEMDLLLRSTRPLVQMHGKWLRTQDSSVSRILRQLRELAKLKDTINERGDDGKGADADGGGSRAALVRVLADLKKNVSEDDLGDDFDITIEGEDDVLTRMLSDGVPPVPEPVPAPDNIDATLRDYQVEGLAWLRWMSANGFGGILADDMGLGKTLQVLSLIALEKQLVCQAGAGGRDEWGHWEYDNRNPADILEREQAGLPRPVRGTLVVAPLSGARNWVAEARRFAPGLRVYLHYGNDRPKTAAELGAIAARHDLIVTTYGVLTRDAGAFAGIRWDRVALDEAQQIKNPRSQVYRAARRVPARHRLAITGTPVENDLLELHAIMTFCNPGLLGSRKQFAVTYAKPLATEQDEQLLASLHRLIDPFILRRAKTDPGILTDLPEKRESDVMVGLTPEQAALYQARVEKFLEDLNRKNEGDQDRRTTIFAALTEFKQICNHPAHYLKDGSGMLDQGRHRSGKVAELERILDTAMAAGERTLIFTQYRRFGEMLVPYLSRRYGTEIPFLHGGTSPARRQRMIEEFNSAAGAPVFVLSLKAGGTAINLTAANHVIHVDRWWNPAVENQATDRAYRLGQDKDVQVHKLTTIGTIEERIAAIIAGKTALAEAVLGGAGIGAIAGLDDAALADMVQLRTTAEARERQRAEVADLHFRQKEEERRRFTGIVERIREMNRGEDSPPDGPGADNANMMGDDGDATREEDR